VLVHSHGLTMGNQLCSSYSPKRSQNLYFALRTFLKVHHTRAVQLVCCKARFTNKRDADVDCKVCKECYLPCRVSLWQWRSKGEGAGAAGGTFRGAEFR